MGRWGKVFYLQWLSRKRNWSVLARCSAMTWLNSCTWFSRKPIDDGFASPGMASLSNSLDGHASPWRPTLWPRLMQAANRRYHQVIVPGVSRNPSQPTRPSGHNIDTPVLVRQTSQLKSDNEFWSNEAIIGSGAVAYISAPASPAGIHKGGDPCGVELRNLDWQACVRY